jgi:hypothetical protein
MRVVVTAGRGRTSVVRKGQTRTIELDQRAQFLIDKGYVVVVRVIEDAEKPQVRSDEPESSPGWVHSGGGWYSHPDHSEKRRRADIEEE